MSIKFIPYLAAPLLAVAALLPCVTSAQNAPSLALAFDGSVLVQGQCDVSRPILGQWDVWFEMVVVTGQGYFPPHTHDGIECVTTGQGIGEWWLGTDGIKRALPPRESFLVPNLAVHTGGNDHLDQMVYLSAHIIRAGAPFRDIVTAQAAPHYSNPAASTAPFNLEFPSQSITQHAFTVYQSLRRLAPDRSYTVPAGSSRFYLGAIDQPLTVTDDRAATQVQVPPGQGYAVPAGTRVRVSNAGNAVTDFGLLEVALQH